MYRHYLNRLRDNFHIMLCMSPIGASLRARCLKFPSLINCCTLVMFDRWPEIALKQVAESFLEEVSQRDLSKAQKVQLAKIFPKMYLSVVKASNAFLQEFGRNVYVTPKNFLDCIQLYISYLEDIKKAHEKKVNRL
jgi:dynein heavy chain, axonemal